MEKALKRLDRLITTAIEPALLRSTTQDTATINGWIYDVVDECENIQQYISYHAAQAKDKESFLLFFGSYQSALVHLSDLLYKYRFSQKDEMLETLYETVSLTVDNLLKHIKYRYETFFNIYGKVPDKDQALARQNIEVGWPKLKEMLLGKSISPELVDIVLEPVSQFLSGEGRENISYYKLGHVKELLLGLDVFRDKELEDPEGDLISCLLYVNLNSLAFYRYCRKYIAEAAQKSNTLKEKLDILRSLYTKFRFEPVKPGIGYDPMVTDFRNNLHILIQTEMEFIEKDERLYTEWEEKVRAKLKGLIKKIKTALTVQEWGIWIRGQLHAGVLIGDNVDDILEIIADTHETPRQKDISFTSMRQKSSVIKNASREKLMKMTMDMYLFIKHYGKGTAMVPYRGR